MAEQMNFQTMREARGYVREMSVEDTEAIGEFEVWQFDNGEVLVVEPGTQARDKDDARLVGTVTQVLV